MALTPDGPLSRRPERFRSSNKTGNWLLVCRDEAREENSDDSGQGDDYKSNLDTDPDDPKASSPSRQRTRMTNRGDAGDETPLKTIVPTKQQQESLGPTGTEGNSSGFAQARDQTCTQQQSLGPTETERNVSGFAQAKNQTCTQQQSLRPTGTEGNASGYAQAKNLTYTQQQSLRLAGTEGNTGDFAQAKNQTCIQQQSLRPAGTEENAGDLTQTKTQSCTQQQSLRPTGTEGNASGYAQAKILTYTQQQSLRPAGKEGNAGDLTQAKNLSCTQQQSLRPTGTDGNAGDLTQAKNLSCIQQQSLRLAGTDGNVGDFAQVKHQTCTQQQSLSPIGTEGNASGFAQARDKNNTQHPHLRPAGMRRESEKKCPTSVIGGQGTVDPERNPTQKCPVQAAATQTPKHDLKNEMSKRCDTRVGASPKRLTVAENIERSKGANLSDRVRITTPMQMDPVVVGSSEPLGQEQGPSATAVIRPSGTMEKSTGVKQSAGASERVQTPLEPGPTPAGSEQVDRDTDVPCTTSVGFLLDLTEGGHNYKIKEEPASEMQSAYGLGAQLLGYEKWKLDKLWYAQVPGQDTKVERVKNILKALKAEGKTMGHVLLYFIQKDSRRLDIVKLIREIHQCDCCKKILKM
ncbi:uncharacterized protein [Haliotis asinina]|uniref:uncharacterized protein n=1 Tax=Haliotis asinina TaxID=109174 RepID=UPI003531A0D6